LEESRNVSVLRASWKQISELINILRYESYIDDQPEIDEIWNICQALIKRNRFDGEEWKIRKNILGTWRRMNTMIITDVMIR